jgi:hypothetical protein
VNPAFLSLIAMHKPAKPEPMMAISIESLWAFISIPSWASGVLLFLLCLLDRTPLQRKIELLILKKILNNLPENITYASPRFLMCDLSDGQARYSGPGCGR